MKTVDISGEIRDFTGKAVRNQDGSSLLVKDVVMGQLWSYETEDTVKAGRIYTVGTKLAQATDKIELEDADAQLVTETFKKPRFVAGVMAQVTERFS